MRSIKESIQLMVLVVFILTIIKFELNNLNKKSFYDRSCYNNHSDRVIIKFNKKVFKDCSTQSIIDLDSISDIELFNELKDLSNQYGIFTISRMFPSAKWGDTLRVNKKNGEFIIIPDWSQVCELKFNKPFPLGSTLKRLKELSIIEYAAEPIFGSPTIIPNDSTFQECNRWAFDKIQAEQAWDITKGDSSITIGIIDFFGSKEENVMHEDLTGKVKKHFGKFGKHGRIVAGIAGAMTNNYKGIASLGWNLKLNFYDASYPIEAILNAIEDSVNVINFSWVIRVDDPFIRDAVKTAIASGIVCVASAGNDEWKVPDKFYPAAYNFGEIGKVIAVSATKFEGGSELFVEGWNYCPGCDQSKDDADAFIDIAAPGCDIQVLKKDDCKSYGVASGTSLAAPFVSALAGLLFSIDNSLSPTDVYNIIISTADKVGQYNYDKNGWNRYLGFGRINALNAVKIIKKEINLGIEQSHLKPATVKLYQNFPNPFNLSTVIKFENNIYQNINIKVYNILGEEIETIVNQEMSPGTYQFEFAAPRSMETISSGIYLFRLETESSVKTVKGILVK